MSTYVNTDKERLGGDYDPQAAMMATLAAGNRVRGGFMYWLHGAPTHVLAELLTELQNDGWELRRVCPTDDFDVAMYEGFWTRLCCGACGSVFEIADDVSSGEEVVCDCCNAKLIVEGR